MAMPLCQDAGPEAVIVTERLRQLRRAGSRSKRTPAAAELPRSDARSKKVPAATMSRVSETHLATLVDGAIDPGPMAADPGVRLVHPPVRTDRLAVLASHVAKQRKEALHPTIDGALIDQDAALASYSLTSA
jgi:hypothetical protein